MPIYVCPTCDKALTVERPAQAPYRPFCCERCKLVDLGRWFDGTYVTSEPAGPEDMEEALGEDGAQAHDTPD